MLVTALTDGAMLVLNELAIVGPFMLLRKLVGSVQVSQGQMCIRDSTNPIPIPNPSPSPSPNPNPNPSPNPNQVSQGRMDHYYEPPQFNVSKRYTYLVANAASVILYGPASPLLYFIGAASLGLMLLVQKVPLRLLWRYLLWRYLLWLHLLWLYLLWLGLMLLVQKVLLPP